MKRVSSELMELLRSIVVSVSQENNQFYATLGTQLERSTYLALNDALERIGGKWIAHRKRHEFQYDPNSALENIVTTGLLPEKNPTAFFPTPREVVEVMFNMIDKEFLEYKDEVGNLRVLEPSGGVGGIADYLTEKSHNMVLDIVEIFEPNQKILKEKGYNPICMDFLNYNTDYTIEYDFIFMNPPFSVKGDKNAYMTHLYHAMNMLSSVGELVAIVPRGWITGKTKHDEKFRNLIANNSKDIKHFKEKTFKDSGTNIATVAILLGKEEWKKKPINGYSTWHEFEFYCELNYDVANYKKIERHIKSHTEIDNIFIDDMIDEITNKLAKKDTFISSEFTQGYREIVSMVSKQLKAH